MTERSGGDRARGIALLALALTIVILPFTSGFPVTDDPSPHLQGIPWADLAAVALIVAAIPLARRAWRTGELGAGAAVWLLLLAPLAVSFVAHPSIFGVQILLRIAAAGAGAIVLASLTSGERVLVLAYFGAVTLAEIAIAWAQVGASGPVGIPGETPGPYEMRGPVVLARGTLYHGYVLAALGMVCAGLALRHGLTVRRAAAWIVLAGLAIQTVGMTQSRAAVLGLAAAIGGLALAARADRRYRWAILALVVGTAVPTVVLRDAWAVKATPEQALATWDRAMMLDQSEVLIRENVALGVGPGNYFSAARARLPAGSTILPVHNFTLLVTAEGGIVAGLVSVAFLLAVAWSALRGGSTALALFGLFVPFLLFDAHPYVTAQGAVLTGLWIGGIDATGVRVRELPAAVGRARAALRRPARASG